MLHQRYVILIFTVIAILSGVTVQAASVSLFEQFAVPNTRIISFLNLTTLLSLGTGAALFAGLLRNARAVSYFDEVVDELHKVTWPTREETLRAASTVVVVSAIVAMMVGLYDLLWKNVADIFLYNG